MTADVLAPVLAAAVAVLTAALAAAVAAWRAADRRNAALTARCGHQRSRIRSLRSEVQLTAEACDQLIRERDQRRHPARRPTLTEVVLATIADLPLTDPKDTR
ncbi:hypothetical protein ACIA7R_31495 [Micromonospora chalcea]